MPHIRPPLYWDDDDNNIDHIWDRHQVTADEIEEMVCGIEGEEPNYLMLREGEGYLVFGQTPDGRLLKLYGEFIESKAYKGSRFRPIHCMDMNADERRRFKERLK